MSGGALIQLMANEDYEEMFIELYETVEKGYNIRYIKATNR